MTTPTSRPLTEPFGDEAELAEIVAELSTEARIIPGIGRALVLFQSSDGGFRDAEGREHIAPDSASHPVHQAAASGTRVRGEWPAENEEGEAVPVRVGTATEAVVWITREGNDEPDDDDGFLVDRAIERFARRLRGASAVACDARRCTALAVADTAARRFLSETSLHRALRLGISDLAELAGALEASIWHPDPSGEPTPLAQAATRMTTPEREEALRRLVSEVSTSHGAVRVLDTAESDHYAWCRDDGIERFLAHPIRAFDALHGVLIIVNFKPAPRLMGGGLYPGVQTAAGILASAAGSALHQVERDERVAALERELRSTRRQLERADQAGARLELARRAASELERALEQETPAIDRALDVLEELRALSEPPSARLKMTSINDAIHDAVEELRSRPAGREANVSVRLQGDVPKLLLDAEKIREMLLNLIEHGVSGTEKREAVVSSRLQKGEVIVELRFPEREIVGGVLESLFLPFSEGGDPKGRLGLTLADQVIGEHGGQLRAKHENRHGLLYWLSLPVSDNEDRRRLRRDRRKGDRRQSLDEAA